MQLDHLISISDEDRANQRDAESELLRSLSSVITWHVAPIIMLAHSRTNLPAKLRVFLHTMALLVDSRSSLAELCHSVVSVHTDYGTESALARVDNVSLDLMLPYLHCKAAGNRPEQEEMFLVPAATEEDCFQVSDQPALADAIAEEVESVDFSNSLEGPDMMHIIHNVTANLEDVVSCYSEMMVSLKAICSLLAGRETKQQIIETCFSAGPSLAYMDMIQSFQVVPHEKRWNTVAAAIEEIHELEGALRMHWNLGRFLGSNQSVPNARPGDTAEGDFGVHLKAVDDGISSPFFWGAIKVLLQVAMLQREAVRFVNGCPCHGQWQDSDLPDLKALVCSCPLRGRRCAELASGDFFQLIQSLLDTSASRLEVSLPRGLTDAQVSGLMQDFEVARQRILTTYVVKLSFWRQPPHVLAGLAHSNPTVRVKCLQKCLSSDCSHPRIRMLSSGRAVSGMTAMFCCL